MNPQVFNKTLQELVEKIQGVGKIELFCSGGASSSKGKIETVKKIVEVFKQTYPTIDLSINLSLEFI
jgi:hypothetical protein